jgi:hypothetical protein
LAAILLHMNPRRVHVPFYICDAALAPMRERGISVAFYRLDSQLRPVGLPPRDPCELVLAVNYFGLQSPLMNTLAKRYGRNFVSDQTQAFFAQPVSRSWTFYSARKFFGVPDGAYLYAPEPVEIRALPNPKADIRHLVNRLMGRQQTGYHQVRRREQEVDSRIRVMSTLSSRLLAGVDYTDVRKRRRENYRVLHRLLGPDNQFDATLPASATPFYYPLLLRDPVDRRTLAKENYFVPMLWPEVPDRNARGFSFERGFCTDLLPLPIDHRYQPQHMLSAVERLRAAQGLD